MPVMLALGRQRQEDYKLEARLHYIGKPCLQQNKTRTNEQTSKKTKLLRASDEVLQGVVKGPCLHRQENWLIRQLNDEPKPVYKVRFIREKGKATAKVCSGAPKPVTPCSGKGWGFYGCFNSGLGGFLICLAFQGLS
jgi:hypothetical protein